MVFEDLDEPCNKVHEIKACKFKAERKNERDTNFKSFFKLKEKAREIRGGSDRSCTPLLYQF